MKHIRNLTKLLVDPGGGCSRKITWSTSTCKQHVCYHIMLGRSSPLHAHHPHTPMFDSSESITNPQPTTQCRWLRNHRIQQKGPYTDLAAPHATHVTACQPIKVPVERKRSAKTWKTWSETSLCGWRLEICTRCLIDCWYSIRIRLHLSLSMLFFTCSFSSVCLNIKYRTQGFRYWKHIEHKINEFWGSLDFI